jgi:hypothetical protein
VASEKQEAIRKLAKEYKLCQVNFLDAQGNMAEGDKVKRVQMRFSNREWIEASILEFIWLGKNVKFTLMTEADWEESGLDRGI